MKIFKASTKFERERESKLVRKLAILNFFLILTVIFLIAVLFNITGFFENPPNLRGVFNLFK